MKRWIGLFCVLGFSLAVTAAPKTKTKVSPAALSSALTVTKGVPITVDHFDPKTNSFSITLNEQRAVGPNFAAPENLYKALGFEGNFKSFMKQKDQMIGSVYTLKNDLLLIYEDDLPKRKPAKPD